MGKRILQRRRGTGRQFTSPSHRHKGGPGGVKYPAPVDDAGQVTDIVHDPGRTAPLLVVAFSKAGEKMMIAPEGYQVGQTVQVGNSAPVATGNVLPLIKVPIGARVFNIEARPGDGGRFARSAGSSGVVVSQGAQVIVQFSSGAFKALDPLCRATIGRPGGGAHQHVGRPSTVSSGTPPGAKVGRLSPQKRKKNLMNQGQ